MFWALFLQKELIYQCWKIVIIKFCYQIVKIQKSPNILSLNFYLFCVAFANLNDIDFGFDFIIKLGKRSFAVVALTNAVVKAHIKHLIELIFRHEDICI